MGRQSIGFCPHLPVSRSHLIAVFTGFTLGLIGAYFIEENILYFDDLNNQYRFEDQSSDEEREERWRDPHSHEDLADLPHIEGEVGQHSQHEEFHQEEDVVAQELAEKVRVLCWVMTSPDNHAKKAVHILATWGKRCNTFLFMSSRNDSSLPVVVLDVPESHDLLWAKTKAAFSYVYEHHRENYDWVLKADDDTYVIVENLRFLLSHYNPSEPMYFGCRFKPFTPQGYMSGGAGYVLSKEAVERFVTKALPDEKKCKPGLSGAEDAEIGKCLYNVGVVAMDSRDEYLRGRFFPFVPEHHLVPHLDPKFWYWSYIYYNTTDGLECCSDTAITFHYMSPQEMYFMEYMIYHLRPYGIKHDDKVNTTIATTTSTTTSTTSATTSTTSATTTPTSTTTTPTSATTTTTSTTTTPTSTTTTPTSATTTQTSATTTPTSITTTTSAATYIVTNTNATTVSVIKATTSAPLSIENIDENRTESVEE